jgi:hypothetical protein
LTIFREKFELFVDFDFQKIKNDPPPSNLAGWRGGGEYLTTLWMNVYKNMNMGKPQNKKPHFNFFFQKNRTFHTIMFMHKVFTTLWMNVYKNMNMGKPQNKKKHFNFFFQKNSKCISLTYDVWKFKKS